MGGAMQTGVTDGVVPVLSQLYWSAWEQKLDYIPNLASLETQVA